MVRAPSLVVLLVVLAACSPDLPADLGESPLDRVELVDAPALAHLAAGIDDADGLTVEDLFRARPRYVRPPDPSPLLAEVQLAHERLPALSAAEPLRVLSYNTGLLDRWYAFATVQVPQVDARRERSPEILLGDGWDVLLLQEVWDQRDVDAFEREAAERGYLSWAGSSRLHEAHGLLMLVREDLVDPDGPDERAEQVFELQRDIEEFPGPGVQRGFLSWRFRHAPTGLVLDLFDTHTTAFPDYDTIRDSQVRELGLVARSAPEDEVVIVAGDINGAPYYPLDAFGVTGGETVEGWWRNAQSYAMLLHYGGLVDTHVAAGQARDVELMDMLPRYGASFAREPYGNRALCEALRGGFTATDCNSLYFEQYAATEYPGRIDYVLLRDAQGRVRVQDSAIQYDDPIAGEAFELSDHYGVGTTLLLSTE